MIEVPDLLHTPLPDEAHEALRVACVDAIRDLTEQSVSMDDFRMALQIINGAVITLNQIANSYAAALPASVTDRAQLNARVAVLEAKPAVRTVALAAPIGLGLLSIGTRDVTLPLDRTLPDTNYEVDLWPSVGLLGATALTVKAKTATAVVVTVKNTAIIAAGGSLGAIAWRAS